MILVNANFQRWNRVLPARRPERETKNIQDIEIAVDRWEDVTGSLIANHPKAPPRVDGWVLQGFAKSVRNK